MGYNNHANILVPSLDTADDRSRDNNIQSEIKIRSYISAFYELFDIDGMIAMTSMNT